MKWKELIRKLVYYQSAIHNIEIVIFLFVTLWGQSLQYTPCETNQASSLPLSANICVFNFILKKLILIVLIIVCLFVMQKRHHHNYKIIA